MTHPKTIKICGILALAAFGLLLGACQSPESRIKASPEAFARLNPGEQALVKEGKIAPGFSMEAVKLALGEPNRVTLRTDGKGQHQIWHYTEYEDNNGVIIYSGYYHHWRGWAGPYFYGEVPYYNGFPARVHERIRVEFDSGDRVSVVEQDVP